MNLIPHRLVAGAEPLPQVAWLIGDGGRYTEPFFQETLSRLRRAPANFRQPPRLTPLRALAAAAAEGPPPSAIVFHVSRCGSTLVAQMLASLGHHTVLAEPPLLDEVLRLPDTGIPLDEPEHLALIRGTLAALARPHAATSRRLFVKADPWALFVLPRLRRAFPDTPFIFLHRHPAEVLASLLRKPSLTLVHDTIAPAHLGLGRAERDRLPLLDYAAAAIGAFFRAARDHRAELIPVDYTALPEWAVDSFPGCTFGDEERTALLSAAQRDAKDPTTRFTPDTAGKRAELSAPARAALARWTLPHYEKFLAADAVSSPPRE